MSGKVAGAVGRESLPWFSRHLAGINHVEPSQVRIFVTGGPGWRDLPDWPPASRTRTLYLDAGSTLSEQPQSADVPPSVFTYDPATPTPTIGGPLLSASKAGYRDDTALSMRDDVISSTTTPLTRDLEVIGTPSVELEHATDNSHADVFVRLSEVNAKGKSRNVTEGYLRLTDEASPVRMTFAAIAHAFAPAHASG